MNMLRSKQSLRTNQQGMAAIIITIVLMTVMSLVVLGFAQITRREQRQSLDRQLSTQAYYAAETGVNLAQSKISKLPAGMPVPSNANCTDSPLLTNPNDLKIDGENTQITCLLVNSELASLNAHGVGMESKVFNVQSKNDNISEITFNWQSSTDSQPSNSCSDYVASSSFNIGDTSDPWDCNHPILRVDLVPLNSGGAINRNTLENQQFTTFFFPQKSAGSSPVAYNNASVASRLNSVTTVRCTAGDSPYRCTGRITGLAGLGSTFGVRFMAIYGTADVNVSARTAAGAATLINGQIVIDSTAKANDILRRIQVSVSPSEKVPDFGIASGGGLCKRYIVSSTVTIDPGTPDGSCDIP